MRSRHRSRYRQLSPIRWRRRSSGLRRCLARPRWCPAGCWQQKQNLRSRAGSPSICSVVIPRLDLAVSAAVRQPRSANGWCADQPIRLELRGRVAATPLLPAGLPNTQLTERQVPIAALGDQRAELLDAHAAGLQVSEAQTYADATRRIGLQLQVSAPDCSRLDNRRPSVSRTSASARKIPFAASTTIKTPLSTVRRS